VNIELSKPKIIQDVENISNEISVLNGAGEIVEKANKSALDTTNTNVTNLSNTVVSHLAEDATDAHTPRNIGIANIAAGDIVYGSGVDALTRLPKGTASQLLAMNAGETAPEWKTVSLSDGAWEKIAEVNLASAVGVIEFLNLDLTNYRFFKLLMSLNNNQSNGEQLVLRINDLSTSTYRNVSFGQTSGNASTSTYFDLGRTYLNYSNFIEALLTNVPLKQNSIIAISGYTDLSLYTYPSTFYGVTTAVNTISKISILNINSAMFSVGSQLILMGVK